MALTISDFKTAATRGDRNVLEVRPQGTVTSTGFFGRVFGSAGKDRATNQATMQTFLGTIEQEYGATMGGRARGLLARLVPEGRPLSGRVVKQVLHDIDSAKRLARQLNWGLFNLQLLEDEGRRGFRGIVNSHIPAGVVLSPNDIEEITRFVRSHVGWCSNNGIRLTRADIEGLIRDTCASQLSRITPASMTMLDEVRNDPDRFGLAGLSPQALQALRPVLIANGVTTPDALRHVLTLANAIRGLLPALAQCQSGPELMALLSGLEGAYQALPDTGYAPQGMTPKAYFMQVAAQAAIATAGMPDDAVAALLKNTLAGAPGSAVARTYGYLVTEGPPDTRLAMRIPHGVFHTLKEGVTSRLSADSSAFDVPEHDTSMMSSYNSLDEVPRDMKRYLRCMGMAIPAEDWEHKRGAYLEGSLQYTAGLAIPAADLWRALESVGPAGGRSSGLGLSAMLTAMDRLKAAQPGSKPFSPGTVWQALFHAPLPAGVTADNLGQAVGEEIERRMETAVQGLPFDHEVARVMFNSAVSFGGIHWERAIGLVSNPGPVRLADLGYPRVLKLSAPPSDALEQRVLSELTGDTQRRGGNSVITIGAHEPIPLRQPVPSEEEQAAAMQTMNEEERQAYQQHVAGLKDYNDPSAGALRISNSVAAAILGRTAELCLTQAQRIGVLDTLSQNGFVPFRALSPLISEDGNTVLYEHSPCVTAVTRQGDSVIVHIETTPDAPAYGRMQYRIAPDGTATLTDLLLDRTGPRAAAASI